MRFFFVLKHFCFFFSILQAKVLRKEEVADRKAAMLEARERRYDALQPLTDSNMATETMITFVLLTVD